MKFVSVVNERIGHSHVENMFAVAVFPHFSRLFLVTFPPHCTLHLQPLDVAIMGPFKAKYPIARSDWMTVSRMGGERFP
jgi:hypothetical protein